MANKGFSLSKLHGFTSMAIFKKIYVKNGNDIFFDVEFRIFSLLWYKMVKITFIYFSVK